MPRHGAPRVLRVEDESACTQIRQRVSCPDSRQARNTTSTYCHDDLGPGTDVVKVAAELVVQLTHTHLGLRLRVM